MSLKVLTEVEQYDYRRLIGDGARLWGEVWFWLLLVAIGMRLFVPVPLIHWLRAGQWCVVFAGFIAFLSVPYLAYELIAQRVRKGTFEIERTLPYSSAGLILSKVKVAVLVTLRWTLPLLAVCWLADPTLISAKVYLAGSFYLNPDSPAALLAVPMAFVWYVGLWGYMLLYMFRVGISGESLIGLYGRFVFWLLAIHVGLAWANGGVVPQPGYLGSVAAYLLIVLLLEMLLLFYVFVMFRSVRRRLRAFG
jgi:hypothetical protein